MAVPRQVVPLSPNSSEVATLRVSEATTEATAVLLDGCRREILVQTPQLQIPALWLSLRLIPGTHLASLAALRLRETVPIVKEMLSIGFNPQRALRPPRVADKVLLIAIETLITEILRIRRVFAALSRPPATVGGVADGATPDVPVVEAEMMSLESIQNGTTISLCS